MLDKSIEYRNIIMKMDKDVLQAVSIPTLPRGFRFRFYENGDEFHWARIETAVLEFSSEKDAYEYFAENFLRKQEELEYRCVFVLNPEGLPIATATAWYADSDCGHQAVLHWVAVCPEYQGLGIGEAIVKKVLCVFKSVEPEEDVFLHTQTWSHIAVGLYHKLGFALVKEKGIAGCENDYSEAMEILKGVVTSKLYLSLVNCAK